MPTVLPESNSDRVGRPDILQTDCNTLAMQSREAIRSKRSSPRLEADEPEQFGPCPLLGTQADPNTAFSFATEDHRCSSAVFSVPVSTIHQKNYCLTAQYGLCPVFNQAKAEVMPPKTVPLPVPQPTPERPVVPAAPPVDAVVEEARPAPFDERVSWLDPDHDALAETTALFGADATTPESSPVLPGQPLIFPWEEQTHPDFAADQDVFPPPPRLYRNVKFRRLLVVLLLLALVPVGWWLVNDGPTIPGFLLGDDPARGIVVTLPTAELPTDEANNAGGDSAGSGDPQATPTAAAGAGGAVEPVTTPKVEATLTDLERIAVTATALFADATPVIQCVAPSWWVNYIIEQGDTIEALAQSRGIQRELLIVANCLAQSELEVGRTIFLPPVGIVADETIEPTDTPTATTTTSPTRAPLIFPTAVTFPTATVSVIIFPTALPTIAPPTAAPPTSAPPPPAPPTAVPTEEPLPDPTSIPTAAPTAPPPEIPTTAPPAPPTQEPGETLPDPPEPTP